MVIHTNGRNKNGRAVWESALEKGVSPNAVTIGHLSDSDDLDYVTEILKSGCYAGFDRIYKSADMNYYVKKAKDIYFASVVLQIKSYRPTMGLLLMAYVPGVIIRKAKALNRK